jgi:hypothetical protein
MCFEHKKSNKFQVRGHMRRKAFSVMLLVVALITGAWALPAPQRALTAQTRADNDNKGCYKTAVQELVGRSADLTIKSRINDICDFQVRLDEIPSNVSEYDKDFIEDSITGNTLELQSLQIALAGATNEEWKGQIRMMISMHTADLKTAIAVAKKIGADTTPNLTHASVYPESPDYDLGMRYENLVEQYIDPLNAALPGGLITPTVMPTDTGTAMPSETASAMATGTAMPSETASAMATDTAMPSETTTAMATDTAMPSETATAMATDTPMVTETATAIPTEGPTIGSAFDVRSLNVLEDEHTSDVQSELAAERLTKNDEIKAFAKHSADVTELHLLFMGDLKHRMVDNYTPPPPDTDAQYQSPRRFEPR